MTQAGFPDARQAAHNHLQLNPRASNALFRPSLPLHSHAEPTQKHM